MNRFSSRTDDLYGDFLEKHLKNAKKYDRIAGYFNSSILSIADEELDSITGQIRVICNSDVHINDVITANMTKESYHAVFTESVRTQWCEFNPEKLVDTPDELINEKNILRFKKLYDLLISNKLKIRIIPNSVYGMIHGKAGVITHEDGSETSFLGSSNETLSGWTKNYELIWEDPSKESVEWVQNEFDILWNNPNAIDIPNVIIDDIKRLSYGNNIIDIETWKIEPEAASVIINTPLYSKECGLWDFQKYFIDLAFKSHLRPESARFILADMVGLGKTIQLATAALLMALSGNKPVLIIVPKTLVSQWQDELINLLDMPTAVWNGKRWVDEIGQLYGTNILECPRKIGIVSQGLFSRKSEFAEALLTQEYECILLDEAHRARRKNIRSFRSKPEPNNLMEYSLKLSKKTKSMLFATATPIQIHPIELWDLLYILAQGNDSVMGNEYSKWRTQIEEFIKMLKGEYEINKEYISDNWQWIKNPLPPASENHEIRGIRNYTGITEDTFVMRNLDIYSDPLLKRKISNLIQDNYFENHNPIIRHVVRRTRKYLEETINEDTGLPYLQKINVELHGEEDSESIPMPYYLEDAYFHAEKFCDLIGKRAVNGGLLKTLLLRRVGSTIVAGLKTANKLYRGWAEDIDEDEDYFEDNDEINIKLNDISHLTSDEISHLKGFIDSIENVLTEDPKFNEVYNILINDNWLERGCIIFSQYYDSAEWIAKELSSKIPNEYIGLYAGSTKSKIYYSGIPTSVDRSEIKNKVKSKELRLLVGTDAASEGLNLQTLGNLINLDLPWNPTRLEQRKGRIQRIGQIYDTVNIYNMRYKNSVEDKVHRLLSKRLEDIFNIFGQIPDTLEDVWVKVALGNNDDADACIDDAVRFMLKSPFDKKYEKVNKVNWGECTKILDKVERKKYLMEGWKND
ncbi:phospholipase D-like domain-containing anti-phage protein [Methanococcus maripaludis]|uniref:Putative DEAD/DEAH box helicase n=1 Tax=Methanococcus maripaludis OS7 TaxID=637915 RepID=A0A2Z5PKS5_METMI|nr:phospholipase D-like domain-containing anti-phage protein [Methanococcus maripaludis]BAP62895.1 putative DEAD/DEAH box helicase [Methanococcus maripaludis OS7]